MHPVRKQRLIFVLFLLFFAGAAAALFGYGLRENINLFYPPSKIVAGEAPVDRQINAGGCVVPGSLVHVENSVTKHFIITDGLAQLSVTTDETLPDLFAEGEATLVTGKLNGAGVFIATKVNPKHDENYMPPEVADSVQNTAEHGKTCEGLEYGT